MHIQKLPSYLVTGFGSSQSKLLVLLLILPFTMESQLSYVDNGNGTATITYPSCLSGTGAIPATINGLKITSIGTSAFYYCTSITNLTIGTNVTSIGPGAFNNCTRMTSVTMPGSLTNIGSYAFEYCSGLTNVTIPNGVTTIGTNAFFYCTSMTRVTLGTNVNSIKDEAFYECGLTGVFFLGNAPSIGMNVFSSDEYNTIVYHRIGTTGWGSHFGVLLTAFWDPSSQLGYTTNNNNATISKYLGSGGVVNIPSTFNSLVVTRIETNAFIGCTGLTSVIVPNSVTSIGADAFADCTGLTSVAPLNNITNIESEAFLQCNNLTNISMGSNISIIQAKTFYYCSNLTSVTIGNNVSSIAAYAFYGCNSLTNITIPKSLTSIAGYAFAGCANLNKVFFQGNDPNLSQYVFSGDNNPTLYDLKETAAWDYFVQNYGIPVVLWNPQAKGYALRTNQFVFNITGTANIPIVVEACNNLASGVWITVLNCTVTNGLISFKDTITNNYLVRFYRIRSP